MFNIDNPLFSNRKVKILCCGMGYPYMHQQAQYLSEKYGYNITVLPHMQTKKKAMELLHKHIIEDGHNDYDAVVNVWLPFSECINQIKLPNLKVISCASSGYFDGDLVYCNKHSIRLTNVPLAINKTVADLAVGLMIATCRNFLHCRQRAIKLGTNNQSESGLFKYCLNPNSRDLYESTVGIIGLGSIGKEIAKRVVFGFDCKCIYFNGNGKPKKANDNEFGAMYMDSFESVLKQSDFVIAVCPLNQQTKYMFNESAFQMMKNDAIFVNIGRGQLCDSNALIKALKLGWIGGAGLDVTDPEPLPSDSELYQLPNCTVLPHIGSSTLKARRAQIDMAIDNMLRVLNGMQCSNIVSKSSKL